MVNFEIIKNLNTINEKDWELSLISKKDGKLFNEKGEEVQSTFVGRQYRLYKRGHKPSDWEKFGLSLLVIFTLGIVLANRYVFKSFIKGKTTQNFAICVNLDAKQPKKQNKDKIENTEANKRSEPQLLAPNKTQSIELSIDEIPNKKTIPSLKSLPTNPSLTIEELSDPYPHLYLGELARKWEVSAWKKTEMSFKHLNNLHYARKKALKAPNVFNETVNLKNDLEITAQSVVQFFDRIERIRYPYEYQQDPHNTTQQPLKFEDLALIDELSKKIKKYQPILKDASTISRLVAHGFEYIKQTLDIIYDTIYVCRDKDKNVQAMALTLDPPISDLGPINYLKIAHIVTNPNNIPLINQDEETCVRGAGTAIITHLAKKCIENKKYGIYLESVESAIPFYEKLGFENFDGRSKEPGCKPMLLTVEKCKSLLVRIKPS